MVLELNLPGSVSDPVVIAEVSHNYGLGSNPVSYTTVTCYGVVNLNLFHPKLLCDPPLRVSGRWVGGSESGWVGQPKSREGQFPPPPVSLSKGLQRNCHRWAVSNALRCLLISKFSGVQWDSGYGAEI